MVKRVEGKKIPNAVLIDFGECQSFNKEDMEGGGTYESMSPEVESKSRKYAYSADIFSIGVLLHKWLGRLTLPHEISW